MSAKTSLCACFRSWTLAFPPQRRGSPSFLSGPSIFMHCSVSIDGGMMPIIEGRLVGKEDVERKVFSAMRSRSRRSDQERTVLWAQSESRTPPTSSRRPTTQALNRHLEMMPSPVNRWTWRKIAPTVQPRPKFFSPYMQYWSDDQILIRFRQGTHASPKSVSPGCEGCDA